MSLQYHHTQPRQTLHSCGAPECSPLRVMVHFIHSGCHWIYLHKQVVPKTLQCLQTRSVVRHLHALVPAWGWFLYLVLISSTPFLPTCSMHTPITVSTLGGIVHCPPGRLAQERSYPRLPGMGQNSSQMRNRHRPVLQKTHLRTHMLVLLLLCCTTWTRP